MPKLNITAEHLKGAIECASTDATRFYLGGAYVHPVDGGFAVVATNGHCLFYAQTLEPCDDFAGLIIPTDAIKLALKASGRAFCLELDTERHTLGAVNFQPVDGTFPDYRRVIPAELSGEPATFAPHVLGACYKALGVKRDGAPAIRTNGKGAAIIGDPESGVFCVAMPYRTNSDAEGYKVGAYLAPMRAAPAPQVEEEAAAVA